MPRKAGRSPEDTRRALMTAAAAAIRTGGLSVPLGGIATAAGVSKGGLLYHFPTKDSLVLALAQESVDTFRAEVLAAVDPDDTAPGRLCRAYVRACLDTLDDDQAVRNNLALVAQLLTDPAVADLLAADARRWNADLAADGLPRPILDLVVAAADGASVAPIWAATLQPGPLVGLRRVLLALTSDEALWERLGSA
ncbi:TetR/AcrR family transcriptional regulator [Actinokineospora bangkokensis]|uniref:TetR family transcriptional regulator n=1 Tax=Actinokineospora bangkokensis TaxID=1193682 RepID=A0A1Q9LNB9_9PSEU|nr:TetR/AcrR family transcriptional regulator [Actinokineospora bangkokensis]OLR93520.1 TetR family transcriptional regulator [Actinokineospora bangkokensis]